MQDTLAVETPVNVFVLDDFASSISARTTWLACWFIFVKKEERSPTMVDQSEAVLEGFLPNTELDVDCWDASTQSQVLLDVQHSDVGGAL